MNDTVEFQRTPTAEKTSSFHTTNNDILLPERNSAPIFSHSDMKDDTTSNDIRMSLPSSRDKIVESSQNRFHDRSPVPNDIDETTTRLRYNRRTPDLDRITKFFKSNKSPGRNRLLEEFKNATLQDTPIGKRTSNTIESKNINNDTTGAIKEGGKFQSTEVISGALGDDNEHSLFFSNLKATNEDEESNYLNGSPRKTKMISRTSENNMLPPNLNFQLEDTPPSQRKSISLLSSNRIPSLKHLDNIENNELLKAQINLLQKENENLISINGMENEAKTYNEDIQTEKKNIVESVNNSPVNHADTLTIAEDLIHPTSESNSKPMIVFSNPGEVVDIENDCSLQVVKEKEEEGENEGDDEEIRHDFSTSKIQDDPNTSDYSRINDTTDASLSNKWVFRPEEQSEFNSNKSTQIIRNGQSKALNNFDSTQTVLPTENIQPLHEEVETQLIYSPTLQNNPIRDSIISTLPIIENTNSSSTQEIISKPSSTATNTTLPETQPPMGDNNRLEPTIEVAETSSPSMNDIYTATFEQTDPEMQQQHQVSQASNNEQESQNLQTEASRRFFLQVSSKPYSYKDSNGNLNYTDQDIQDNLALSEAEVTQELPELEEESVSQAQNNADQDNEPVETNEVLKSLRNDSQDIVYSRRKMKRKQFETVEISKGEEHRSSMPSPKKRLIRGTDFMREEEKESVTNKDDTKDQEQEVVTQDNNTKDSDENERTYNFPTELRNEDTQYLSRNDIQFENAIWSQYTLNYQFYPGILLPKEISKDRCWVLFYTGKEESKREDVYYLDIRIGDTVNWNGNKYVVTGLNCESHDPNIIRCVRGYDTVYMRKKTVSGGLGKRTFIKPLSVITIDLDEWAKRPKIILEDGISTKGKAHKDLEHPIRGRKSIFINSPRKTTRRATNEESDIEAIIKEPTITPIKKPTGTSLDVELPLIPVSLKSKNSGTKIFDKCLFVLSNIYDNKAELCHLIESNGGKVIELGFASLFDNPTVASTMPLGEDENIILRESQMHLEWNPNSPFKDYKFACLLAKRHLRSLKYLETLALGWPILHWKFIHKCLKNNKLLLNSIYEFLLPAGESFRLGLDRIMKTGIIKSYNIHSFYSKLLEGSTLQNQVSHLKNKMSGYIVLFYGYSQLDDFLKFLFECLGINKFYESDMDVMSEDYSKPLLIILEKLFDVCMLENYKILVYMSDDTGKISSSLLDEARKDISEKFGGSPVTFHVEGKEWLIQTIVNESTGFEDEDY
ncbi:chromatin-binding protein RAD9 NDAI_0C04870 [Naumovozyma dairenensis CBS 421]|uniref:BRCT domain-containing protein n=1 Tax=Naumovozyma dairenensis (strain ATCC 10597 / BCRC 20456 / CBS 421 / NBRC 0211 / NRRL Y-12639) TaxID=1071378 RepID=G0W8N5_NAUDC|nr:hypothetical protein NDAI_0C04870 [Naumovozyma dairenensis CBS 421]CCD24146.1 hypothetical protein NDAI_0C04870 [Naumovozyma dairenensis CBS 421]